MGSDHFSGQSVPMLNNPFCEEIVPNIPSKTHLVQLEAIFSHPISYYFGEETNSYTNKKQFRHTFFKSQLAIMIHLHIKGVYMWPISFLATQGKRMIVCPAALQPVQLQLQWLLTPGQCTQHCAAAQSTTMSSARNCLWKKSFQYELSWLFHITWRYCLKELNAFYLNWNLW